MNGAESLVRTFVGGGVTTCFANPGTSEMHFVAALDRVEGMRCVLGLFEGVVTGAADGYGRMTRDTAITLLHLAPGLGNGLANIHNASRAQSPMVNVVGDHATYHKQYDAPLNADIEGVARPYSKWLRTSMRATDIARDGAEAVVAARTAPGQIATLILPANTAWEEGGPVAPIPAAPRPSLPSSATMDKAAEMLRNGKPTGIVLAGTGLSAAGLDLAGRIAVTCGAELFAPYSVARIERGAGRVPVERIPYVIDQAVARLAKFPQMLLIGAPAPVAFFAYPNKPSVTTREDCNILTLAKPGEDLLGTLAALAEAVSASKAQPPVQKMFRPAVPSGAFTLPGLAEVIAALVPENAIVIDEAITSGRGLGPAMLGCPPHDLLAGTGGSIGFAMPVAIGAAVACPDRRVLCLESDGSAMYTPQSLWTMARESLNVTTVLFNNGSYNILKTELANVGAGNPGRKALDMLEIGHPDIGWRDIARGLGIPASRATNLDEFAKQLGAGLNTAGPTLIEVKL